MSYEEKIARGMNPDPDESEKPAGEVAETQGTRVWNQWEGDKDFVDANEAADEREREQTEAAVEATEDAVVVPADHTHTRQRKSSKKKR
jgi:hypothetical protein